MKAEVQRLIQFERLRKSDALAMESTAVSVGGARRWLRFRQFYSLGRSALARLGSARRIFSMRLGAKLSGTTLIMGRDVRVWTRAVVNGLGRVEIGEGVVIGYPMASAHRLPILLQAREPEAVIEIGARTALVDGVEVLCRKRVRVGTDTLLAARCILMDSDFHKLHPDRRREEGISEPIEIGSRCWLGYEVVVLKGVTIGEGAVVGARAVVTRDLGPFVVAVGATTRVLARDVYGEPYKSDGARLGEGGGPVPGIVREQAGNLQDSDGC